jgi:hypothetical protein
MKVSTGQIFEFALVNPKMSSKVAYQRVMNF